MKNKKNAEILSIIHDSRIKKNGGIIGTIESINNIIREKLIYKSIYVERTNFSHVFAEPKCFIIQNTEKVRKIINKLDINLLTMNSSMCDLYSDYYEIIFTNGNSIKILNSEINKKQQQLLDTILNDNCSLNTTSEKYIDKAPILDYTNSNMNNKLAFFHFISPLIEQKNKKSFFKYIDKDCKLTINKNLYSIKGKTNIKKHINQYVGIFNQKIKYEVATSIYGYTNSRNHCDILLGISHYHKGNKKRTTKCLAISINNNKIKTIRIYDENEIYMKELNNVALDYLSKGELNEFNESIALKIKNSNLTFDEAMTKMFGNNGTKTKLKDIAQQDKNSSFNSNNIK